MLFNEISFDADNTLAIYKEVDANKVESHEQ